MGYYDNEGMLYFTRGVINFVQDMMYTYKRNRGEKINRSSYNYSPPVTPSSPYPPIINTPPITSAQINDCTKSIQHYSVFISYSHQDELFARRLHNALQGKGVRCWYAPEEIQGGKKLHEQIDEAIGSYDKLLLILSEHSMNSDWVKTEIANARRQEVTQKRRMLFPLRLVDFEKIRNWTCFDADTGKDSAREIREYFIPDFSKWKDYDSFEQVFSHLLRDLKAEDI